MARSQNDVFSIDGTFPRGSGGRRCCDWPRRHSRAPSIVLPSGLGFGLFPVPFGGLDDEAFFDGVGGHADVADFAVHDGLDALEIGEKTAFGDGGDVRADAAFFLVFAAAPAVAALHGGGAGQFTNFLPKMILSKK